MRRAIVSLLALVLLLTPALGVARAVDYTALTAELNAVKLSDIPKYDTPLPTGGTKKTEKDFYALLSKYPYKESTKGTSGFTYVLLVSKGINYDNSDSKLNTVKVSKEKNWFRYEEKDEFYAGYGESLCLMSVYDPNEVGKTRCYLSTEDKTYYYNYSWYKAEKTGTLWKNKKETATPGPTQKPPVIEFEYMLYKDEKLLGQTCKVFSIKETRKGEDGYSHTNYQWLSTENGKIIKSVYISGDNTWQDTRITFVDYRLNKPADFYTPPKNVKFTEQTY